MKTSRRKTVKQDITASQAGEDCWEVVKTKPVYLPDEPTSAELISEEWFSGLQSLPREAVIQQVKKLQKMCQLYVSEAQRLLIRSNKLDDVQASFDRSEAIRIQQVEEIMKHQHKEWCLENALRESRERLVQTDPIIEDGEPLKHLNDLLDLRKRSIWVESDKLVARAISRMVVVDAESSIKYSVFVAGIEIETSIEHPIDKRRIYLILKKILRIPLTKGDSVQGVKMRSPPVEAGQSDPDSDLGQ